MIPAFELCVWTTSGLSRAIELPELAIGARRSVEGRIARISSGISSTFKWRCLARSKRSPSGPSAGPVIRVTSSPKV